MNESVNPIESRGMPVDLRSDKESMDFQKEFLEENKEVKDGF